MNTEERIKELEEKQSEISKELEELKKEKEVNDERWRAENGGEYYYIDCNGDILVDVETFDETSDFRYSVGNYFKTKEKAKLYKQNHLIYRQLKDVALRLNNNKDNDWSISQNKYYIYFDFNEDKFRLLNDIVNGMSITEVYCIDKNFLNVAIEEIGEEKLKQLLAWGIQ